MKSVNDYTSTKPVLFPIQYRACAAVPFTVYHDSIVCEDYNDYKSFYDLSHQTRNQFWYYFGSLNRKRLLFFLLMTRTCICHTVLMDGTCTMYNMLHSNKLMQTMVSR